MKAIRIASYLTLAASAIFQLTVMYLQHELNDLTLAQAGIWILVIGFPLAATGVAVGVLAKRAPQAVTMLLGSIAVCALCVYIILRDFYIWPEGPGFIEWEEQRVYDFVLVPIVQVGIGLAATTVALFLSILWPYDRPRIEVVPAPED